ncbi:J domain-containing protein [Chamaesiphon minutus]|uniref:Tetratricopeptide repeat protein,DnaJ-like protein n=1 Tax=Chamaesiphon minutus (strain ATCC 27169 / PCC 6605) TaxID=1173020 RepID=K9UKC7_CHAP6|nr:J domain-containing protein [Chamaesiphon minutus]AFY95118.1 tetratricopeptide repeat protein,DnaJ-like protein [Chamaesiphon minutus PCC 6605]
MSFQLDRGLFQYDFIDRHAILGVSVNAQEVDIRERYQAVARLLHPDCAQWKTDTERQMAVRLFSRLITHAYGQLSRQSQLQEQIIMLELFGKRLLEEGNQVQIIDPLCQQLYQSGADFEQVYDRLLQQLVSQQYIQLNQSEQTINQISELNMVYLLRRQLQSVRSTPPTAVNSSKSTPAKETNSASTELAKPSPIEGALRRAEDYTINKNWAKAVPEIKEVISAEPNNVRAHTLLGLVYMHQKQMTMAKISINKAIQLAPKDPQVIQAKQEFERLSNPKTNGSGGKNPPKKPSEGMFSGLFGKK